MNSGFPFPTDNLYKFIAISGLGLYVYALTFPPHGNMDRMLAEFDQRSALLSKRAHNKIQFAELARRVHAGRLSKESKEFKTAQVDVEIDSSMDEILKSRIDILDRQRSWANQNSYIAMEIGAVAMIIGFALWYSKQQIYEDALIRAEAHQKAAKHLNSIIPPWIINAAALGLAAVVAILIASAVATLKSF